MKIVEGGDNEYTVEPDETVWINFDTLHWANLRIRVSEDGGAFQDVTGHYYSFIGNDTPKNLVFQFNFVQPGYCSIDGSGSKGGDTYAGRARFMIDRPDQKEFSFHP